MPGGSAMHPALVRDHEYGEVDRLVAGAGLPLDDIDRCRAHQLVVREGDAIVGTAALEVRGEDAILRSVAVAPSHRGRGLGDVLVRAAIERAREQRLRGLYLLTETAADFFPRFGFERSRRQDAPEAILASAEYCTVCGSSAVAMTLDLQGARRAP